jgi:multidrug transporter EmrE-like cation transporter
MPYIITFIGAVFNIFGDILLKKWSDGQLPIYYGLSIYVVDAAIFAVLLKMSNNFVQSLILWELVVVLIGTTWGYFFHDDKLSTVNFMGIALSVLSIYLVEHK